MQTVPTNTNTGLYCEDDRIGLSVETLKSAFLDNLFYIQGKFSELATMNDHYMALAYTIRDRLLQRWVNTAMTYTREGSRTVSYLSAEFLMGPHLGNNLINLGIYAEVEQAMTELGLDFQALIAHEEEPGLGNGGLGRLAACYIDSLASLEIPAIGYGIRYEYGIFDQKIENGWQVEITDKWLVYGNPWELARPEWDVEVKFGGHTETYTDNEGRTHVRWVPVQVVRGVPYDTPILGYQVSTANTLRLWKSEASESFDFAAFNRGDYYGAVEDKIVAENLTKVLYPNDEQLQGKRLRLQQQYFFVTCSLRDMIRIAERQGLPINRFHEKFTIQLNDTHPAIAVAELMRILLDDHMLTWAEAWDITQKSLAYTNHTLLPEALEKWAISLFASLLPRHLEIIYEINRRFLDQVRVKYLNDCDKLERLSLIDESGERYVRMAHLACVGSHAINGVAALHTELLKRDVLNDFYAIMPEKFSNKTNGVTPRRWMVLANPRLTELISGKIGSGWIKNLDQLRQLEPYVEDAEFRQQWQATKAHMKQVLAAHIAKTLNIQVNPNSLFDVQVKRIHEYKRQHLVALYIVHLYEQLRKNPDLDVPARTFIFAGKAAPGYYMAKLIIKLINSIADVVNSDPDIGDRLKVVFLPDYNVTNSQRIYPAADLSEQVSTAGKEASGTGNMKFALNGALTIGTLDGANVEIREEAGADNFFLFGLTTQEVYDLKAQGYNPMDYYHGNQDLQDVINLIRDGFFSHGDSNLFRPIIDNLLYSDPYMLLADYQSYVDCHAEVAKAYQDPEHWTRMSIYNSVRMGKFSSDRSIREYCEDIWQVQPVPISLENYTANRALSSYEG